MRCQWRCKPHVVQWCFSHIWFLYVLIFPVLWALLRVVSCCVGYLPIRLLVFMSYLKIHHCPVFMSNLGLLCFGVSLAEIQLEICGFAVSNVADKHSTHAVTYPSYPIQTAWEFCCHLCLSQLQGRSTVFVVRMHYMIFHVSRLPEADTFKTHVEVCEFAVSIIADQHAKEEFCHVCLAHVRVGPPCLFECIAVMFHVSRLPEDDTFMTHLEICGFAEFAVWNIADKHSKEGAVAN